MPQRHLIHPSCTAMSFSITLACVKDLPDNRRMNSQMAASSLLCHQFCRDKRSKHVNSFELRSRSNSPRYLVDHARVVCLHIIHRMANGSNAFVNREQIKSRFENLKIWTRRDERAPHKPLLVLYALGRLRRDGAHWLPYEEVKENLSGLLIEFGPPRPPKTSFPFLRLANDGIWELSKPLDTKRDHSDSELLSNQVAGGFTQEVYDALLKDPSLVGEVAQFLLHQHFPETMHEDILAAVGLNISLARPGEQDLAQAQKARRDPEFRERVLRAYEYRCAVCGFDVRLGHVLVALDAAHIKWWQAGGPDVEANGLALCSMHHKLFDRGVFTIASTDNSEFIIQVSEEAHGTIGLQEWVLGYHGKPIRPPQRPEYFPAQDFMKWHANEVFRGKPRYLAR